MEALHLIGRVAVWRHSTGAPTQHPMLHGCADGSISGSNLEQLMRTELTRQRDVRNFQLAFHDGMPVRYELLEHDVIVKLIQSVDAELATSGAHQFAEELVHQWGTVPGSGISIASEAADFMASVAREPENPTVYCFGASSESVAIACMRQGRAPTLVSLRPPSAAVIYALLSGADAEFEMRHPLLSSTDEMFPGKLGAAFAAPPLSAKAIEPLSRNLALADFGVQTAEGSYVQYLARDVVDTTVILVSNRFLFMRGPEEHLRRFLVDSGRLRAVISFPSGLLSTPYVPFTLFVLGKMNSQRHTVFCRVDEARHMSSAAGKLRAHDRRFIGHDEVLSALTVPIAPWSRAVTREEIQKRDYVLSVERYLSTNVQAAIRRASGDRDTVTLGDLVAVVKPQSLRSIEGSEAVPVLEVGPGELPEFRFLTTTSRQRRVDPQDLTRYSQQIIQAEDVILSVKGTIGRSAVAMPISRAIPIVPSQASVILRLNRRGPITDPVVLHMYLRSPLFQALLGSIVTGTTIPNVTLSDLREIPMIALTTQEQMSLRRAFESQMQIQRHLDELKLQQESAGTAAWAATRLTVGTNDNEPANEARPEINGHGTLS